MRTITKNNKYILIGLKFCDVLLDEVFFTLDYKNEHRIVFKTKTCGGEKLQSTNILLFMHVSTINYIHVI